MESRKIVKSGNTSFILALPIKWIRKNNLDSGKLVYITENELGDLVIAAGRKEIPRGEDYVTIKVDGIDTQSIFFKLLTAYTRDANSIILEGKEIGEKTTAIMDMVKTFIGLDVIEQTIESIVVKNFFTLDDEMSPYLLLRKVDVVNRAQFKLLQNFFEQNFANEDYFEIQKLHEQNDRLYVLIRKIFLKLLEQPKLMKIIKTNTLQVAKEKAFSQSLVAISYRLVSLGKSFLLLGKNKHLEDYYTTVYENYKKVVNAIHNKDYEDIYDFLKEYKQESESFKKYAKTVESPPLIRSIDALAVIHYNIMNLAYEVLL